MDHKSDNTGCFQEHYEQQPWKQTPAYITVAYICTCQYHHDDHMSVETQREPNPSAIPCGAGTGLSTVDMPPGVGALVCVVPAPKLPSSSTNNRRQKVAHTLQCQLQAWKHAGTCTRMHPSTADAKHILPCTDASSSALHTLACLPSCLLLVRSCCLPVTLGHNAVIACRRTHLLLTAQASTPATHFEQNLKSAMPDMLPRCTLHEGLHRAY